MMMSIGEKNERYGKAVSAERGTPSKKRLRQTSLRQEMNKSVKYYQPVYSTVPNERRLAFTSRDTNVDPAYFSV